MLMLTRYVGILHIRFQCSPSNFDKGAGHPSQSVNLASYSLVPCRHGHPAHLWSFGGHVRRIRVVFWGDGVVDHHLTHRRILPELVDAVYIPSTAGAGAGSILAVEYHDSWKSIPSGTS